MKIAYKYIGYIKIKIQITKLDSVSIELKIHAYL